MKLRMILIFFVLVGVGATLQAMERQETGRQVLGPLLRTVRSIPHMLLSTMEANGVDVRGNNNGSSESSHNSALTDVGAQAVHAGEGTSNGHEFSAEDRAAALRNDIKKTFMEEAPKQYIKALRLAKKRGKKAKERSKNLFEALAFTTDGSVSSWVRKGSARGLERMLRQDKQTESARYNRCFTFIHGDNEEQKEGIKSFYNLYRTICDSSHKDELERTLARYQAAHVIAELKKSYPDIYDQSEGAKIQQAMEDSRATLIRKGILSTHNESRS